LDPYGSLISELVRRGWTYRAIARILAEKCNIQVTVSTIHYFVHVRFRAKRNPPKFQPPKLGKKPVGSTARDEEKRALSAEKETLAGAEVYQRIASRSDPHQSKRLMNCSITIPMNLSIFCRRQ
jgi:IS30 family transposase